ncbi:Ribonuclease H-like domain [Phytophthora cactorum]|nr:Ribonuclease H-like domain [Phytophthora cactorum]
MLMRDYSKRLDDCLFVVGDNCATNQRMATLVGVPLVGCASHRLSLAVQGRFSKASDDLDQVKKLMTKLKGLNQSAKLRFKTPLRPVLSQVTRWSSTFAMSPANRRLCKFLDDLSKIESVSKELQSSSVSLLDARVYFDGLLELHPSFSTHLSPRAPSVHSPHFEAACVKVLVGKADELTGGREPHRFAHLSSRTCHRNGIGEPEKPLLFKRRKLATRASTRYQLIPAIPPTSNHVERLFSTAKATLGTQRHSLRPDTLEMILMLRANELECSSC